MKKLLSLLLIIASVSFFSYSQGIDSYDDVIQEFPDGRLVSKVSGAINTIDILNGFVDRNDAIKMVYRHGVIGKDYLWCRDTIGELVQPFYNLDSLSKEVACEYCSVLPDTAIVYFMTKGMSQSEAIGLYFHNKAIDIDNAAKACHDRVSDHRFKEIVITYLPLDQAETFLDATRSFMIDYRKVALFGTEYGDVNDGIMDYIKSTGSYVGGGLLNYTLNTGLQLSDFINDLENLLIN